LVAAAKFLVAAKKKKEIFVVPNFVAETKPFFFVFIFRMVVIVRGLNVKSTNKWLAKICRLKNTVESSADNHTSMCSKFITWFQKKASGWVLS